VKKRPYTEDEIRKIIAKIPLGHSDFPNNTECPFDYTKEDHGFWTSPYNLITGIGGHFRPLKNEGRDHGTMQDVDNAITTCDAVAFQKYMHQAQDYFSHYNKGYRAWEFTDFSHFPPGHMWSGTFPDEDLIAWSMAYVLTWIKLGQWNSNCCLACPKKDCLWIPKSRGKCAK
jgi:hypothetical protein